MPTVGVDASITSTGLNLPRAADWLTDLRADFEAETGLSPDWDDDTWVSHVLSNLSERLGAASELLQAVHDTKRVANAAGPDLDDLLYIAGVALISPTYSTVTITITGTPSAPILAGFRVKGGGDDGTAEWQLSDNVVIGVGGTVDATFTARDIGRVTALAGEITAVVTPNADVTAVTNAAAATPGSAVESDVDKRARLGLSRGASSGGSSNVKVRAKLLNLGYITAAVVHDNPEPTTEVVNGVTLDPFSVNVIVLPNPLTTAQITEVLTLLGSTLAPGQMTYTDVSGTVAIPQADGTAGVTRTVGFDYGTDLSTAVEVTAAPAPGYTFANIQPLIADAVERFIDGNSDATLGTLRTSMTLGQPLRTFRLNDFLADEIPGLDYVSQVRYDTGSGFTTSDVIPTFAQRIRAGAITVLETP